MNMNDQKDGTEKHFGKIESGVIQHEQDNEAPANSCQKAQKG